MDIFDSFTAFDWVVLTLIGLLALAGLVRGFTHEALSLAGWIAAIICVRFFHQDVTLWLTPHVGGKATGAIVAFLLLFFGTVIAARLIAGAAGGFAKRSLLGPMDRVLGLGFGALKGLILASAIFLLTQFATGLFDPEKNPPDWLIKSRSAPLLAISAEAMVGWVNDLQVAMDQPPAGLALPEGHPELSPGYGGPDFEAPGFEAPGFEGRQEDGYSREDRAALDKLLEEGAKSGDEVSI